ncbi:MAG: GlsB/YeaQ/YmgE family stress response membrane protein [Planctomycetaceae bacterium]|nr:GlsB/YeaQ/YmgE family stress response membrane protein [Planctomycetaceae bacterium]
MGILSWIVMGLIAGMIAKLLMPGPDPGGIFLTIILGVVGGLVGGFIATRIGWGTVDGFNLRSLFLAVGGSMLLLVIYRLVSGRRAT